MVIVKQLPPLALDFEEAVRLVGLDSILVHLPELCIEIQVMTASAKAGAKEVSAIPLGRVVDRIALCVLLPAPSSGGALVARPVEFILLLQAHAAFISTRLESL
nr:hypothetical protein [Nocardiopsis prasina]